MMPHQLCANVRQPGDSVRNSASFQGFLPAREEVPAWWIRHTSTWDATNHRRARRGLKDPRSPFEREPAGMPVIKIRDNEPFEVAMKRFKKQCEKAGILSELKRREYYDKPSVRKKKKAAAARKRALKKQRRMAR